MAPYEVKAEEAAPLSEEVRERIEAWIRDEFAAAAAFDAETAAEVARSIVRKAHARDLEAAWARQSRLVSEATDAVTCARATAICPGGSSWWHTDGERCRLLLLQGDAGEAAAKQAEMVAGPFDLDMDFNWPEDKLFEIGVRNLPTGLQPGQTIIGGDGEGGRLTLEVVERDGRVGLRVVPGTHSHSTQDFGGDAWDDLHHLLVGRS